MRDTTSQSHVEALIANDDWQIGLSRWLRAPETSRWAVKFWNWLVTQSARSRKSTVVSFNSGYFSTQQRQEQKQISIRVTNDMHFFFVSYRRWPPDPGSLNARHGCGTTAVARIKLLQPLQEFPTSPGRRPVPCRPASTYAQYVRCTVEERPTCEVLIASGHRSTAFGRLRTRNVLEHYFNLPLEIRHGGSGSLVFRLFDAAWILAAFARIADVCRKKRTVWQGIRV